MIFNANPKNYEKELELMGGMSSKKDWVNASPTSTFKGQTITAQQMGLTDLSSYDIALVAFRYYNTTDRQPPMVMCEKDKAIRCNESWDQHYTYFRSIEFNDDGVTFGDCYYGKLLQNNSVDNTGLIPEAIYIIKGVQ